jgi:hypothetical protein
MSNEVDKIDNKNVAFHAHNGIDSPRLTKNGIDLRALGFFQTVGSAPTAAPNNFLEQIQLYLNGSDWELYVYDTSAGAWRKFNYYTP